MSLDKVFCTMPWMEVHINADGSYQTCGDQPNRTTGTDYANQYNINTMSVTDWINSSHQRHARLEKASGIDTPLCNQCYQEDLVGSSSKRVKENLKSKIHPLQFYKTYTTSPDWHHFDYSLNNQGHTNYKPISYHVSLGNECNLACRMCVPWASSRVAQDRTADGTYTGPIRMNWTTNQQRWDELIDLMCNTDNLQFVHVIGGEPLINPMFENLADRLIAAGRTNIYFGFTTNGTILNLKLIEKLKVFRHLEIGMSIECTGKLNNYIRKGCNTEQVLDNIKEYAKHREESHVYVTVRPVPSALSVHKLDDLYRWCLEQQLDVLTNFLFNPQYLQIRHLPQIVKNRLLEQYAKWEYSISATEESNPRDPNRYKEHIDEEIRAVITALKMESDPTITKTMYQKLEGWAWFKDPDIRNYFF